MFISWKGQRLLFVLFGIMRRKQNKYKLWGVEHYGRLTCSMHAMINERGHHCIMFPSLSIDVQILMQWLRFKIWLTEVIIITCFSFFYISFGVGV